MEKDEASEIIGANYWCMIMSTIQWDGERIQKLRHNSFNKEERDRLPEFKNKEHDIYDFIHQKVDDLCYNTEKTIMQFNSENNKRKNLEKDIQKKRPNINTASIQSPPIESMNKPSNENIGHTDKKSAVETSNTNELSDEQSMYSIEKEPKFFGWKNLGKRTIEFDTDLSEYVYRVEEPLLSSKEEQVKKDLLHLFQFEADIDVSEMTTEEKKDYLFDLLVYLVKKHRIKINEKSKNKIFYYLFRKFIGYGKIDILMNDDEIEDISCDGPSIPIFIYHRNYESIRTNVKFSNKDQLDSFAIKLAQLCGKQLSIYEPIVDGKLPDGSRLQTTLAKTVTNSSTFTIRRFREDPLTPVDLVNFNTMSLEMVSYYWLAMEHGTSMLFCGGTASGKTTLLNALSLFLPSTFKIVSVEDTREINLPHENWIAGTTRQGFSTGSEEKTSKDIDMFDLIRAALRQRPRVIIVGEVRGKEAYTLFQAMATGHLSYSTMHAADINTLIQRLENPPIELPRTLMTSLDIVTFLTTFQRHDGSLERRVNSVIEIIKQEPESKRLISVTPYTWNSALNDTFKYHGGSKVLRNMAKKRGWSQQQLHDELANRQEVLQWMVEKNIRSYKDVGSIVAQYKKNPKQVLNKIKQDAL
jgi:flagellar protein FlaI